MYRKPFCLFKLLKKNEFNCFFPSFDWGMVLKTNVNVGRVGCLNVRGANDEAKRIQIGMMCKNRKLDLLGLTETKVKGVGEINFGMYKGAYAGVSDRMRAKEGVAIVMSEKWWACVKQCERVSSRLMWVRLKLRKENWVFVCAYAPPVSSGNEAERDQFWSRLDRCLESFGERDNVCLLGDLNARVGNRMVKGVVGPHGVEGVNDNGVRLLGLCGARGLIIGNTWFEKRSIHKYTWVSGVNGGLGLLDYVCVKKSMHARLVDVNVLRGAAMGISDHYLVEAKLRLKKRWVRYKKERAKGMEVIRVEKLEDKSCSREYRKIVNDRWIGLREGELEGVEEEWGTFKENLVDAAKKACGTKRLGGKGRRKGSEWWCREVEMAVKRKKEAFVKYLGARLSVEALEEYRESRREVKRAVRVAKKNADDRWAERIMENGERNKMF